MSAVVALAVLWKPITFTPCPPKQKIPNGSGYFFMTFTCFNWLPLIETTSGYDLVYNWFDVLKENGHQITGYVIGSVRMGRITPEEM